MSDHAQTTERPPLSVAAAALITMPVGASPVKPGTMPSTFMVSHVAHQSAMCDEIFDDLHACGPPVTDSAPLAFQSSAIAMTGTTRNATGTKYQPTAQPGVKASPEAPSAGRFSWALCTQMQ